MSLIQNFQRRDVSLLAQTGAAPAPAVPSKSITEYLTSTFGLEVAALATIAAGSVWKFVIQPRMERISHSLNYSIERENKLRGCVYQLLDISGADRATLLIFKNGDKLLSGNPLFKVFAFDEATQPGIVGLAESFRDIPSARISGMLKRLKDSEFYEVIRLLEPPLDDFISLLFFRQGIAGAVAIMLKDSSGHPQGVCLLTYGRNKLALIETLDKLKVTEKTQLICALLTETPNKFLGCLLNWKA